MADTRTYDPSAGDPLGDAIRAQIGGTVRPAQPGTTAPKASPALATPSIGSLGSFTFKAVTPTSKPDAAASARDPE